MDQFISAGAVEGHPSLKDCRALTLAPTMIPDGAVVAVMDTMSRRKLVEGAYGERRAACERSVAQHVVSENQRTIDAVAASEHDEIARLGSPMAQSHASLRDDDAASGPYQGHQRPSDARPYSRE